MAFFYKLVFRVNFIISNDFKHRPTMKNAFDMKMILSSHKLRMHSNVNSFLKQKIHLRYSADVTTYTLIEYVLIKGASSIHG